MALSAYGASGEDYGDGTYYGAGSGPTPTPTTTRVIRSPRYGLTRVVVVRGLIWLLYG